MCLGQHDHYFKTVLRPFCHKNNQKKIAYYMESVLAKVMKVYIKRRHYKLKYSILMVQKETIVFRIPEAVEAVHTNYATVLVEFWLRK